MTPNEVGLGEGRVLPLLKPSSLLVTPLTGDQVRVLEALYWSVTVNVGPAQSWPLWNYVRSMLNKSGMSQNRIDEAVSSLPEADAGGLHPYSLVWRSKLGAGRIIQADEMVGLTLAGLARVDESAANGLARLAGAAADREADLPVDRHQLPSEQWQLTDAIPRFLRGAPRAGDVQDINPPTAADLLKREPVQLAQDRQGFHLTYEVQLGGRLGLFQGIENAKDYVQALDMLASSPRPSQPGREHASIGNVSTDHSQDPGQSSGDRRAVFLVHGRNSAAKSAMAAFLKALDLRVISWAEAKSEARRRAKENPSTLAIVRAGMDMAHGVVILFTPDEWVRLDPEFVQPDDGPDERDTVRQARPNVIFEAGLALGLDPSKVLFVRLTGRQRTFTDLDVNWTNIADNIKSRNDLAKALRDLDLAVKTDDTDWHTAGKFSRANMQPSEAPPFDRGPGETGATSTLVEDRRETIQRHRDEHRKALRRELDSIEKSAQAQGWTFTNSRRGGLQLTSPRNISFKCAWDTEPLQARVRLRSFVNELRAGGLRVNRLVRVPVLNTS